MRTDRINREIAAVTDKYPDANAVDEPGGSVGLVIPKFPLPAGFTSEMARIAVRIPALYPTEKLDLFWLDPAVACRDGAQLPNVMTHGVTIAGEQWTQISGTTTARTIPIVCRF